MVISGWKIARNGRVIQGNLTHPVRVIAVEDGAVVKPLAIGIKTDLLKIAKPDQKARLRQALRHYTSRTDYLQALAEDGSMRHDISGEPVEHVSDDHRAKALWLMQQRAVFGADPVAWAKGSGLKTANEITKMLMIPLGVSMKAFSSERKRKSAQEAA